MGFYRKKPVTIEAIQWNGNNIFEIKEFCGQDNISYKLVRNIYNPGTMIALTIVTLEGCMKASIGDYIIKGVDGEFYPCKKSIFDKTYEAVSSVEDS